LFVLGWDYAVDSFYWISGFTCAAVCYERLYKKRNLSNPLSVFYGIADAWGHKFYKVYPVYIALILYYWKIMPLLGHGPIWHRLVGSSKLCDD